MFGQPAAGLLPFAMGLISISAGAVCKAGPTLHRSKSWFWWLTFWWCWPRGQFSGNETVSSSDSPENSTAWGVLQACAGSQFLRRRTLATGPHPETAPFAPNLMLSAVPCKPRCSARLSTTRRRWEGLSLDESRRRWSRMPKYLQSSPVQGLANRRPEPWSSRSQHAARCWSRRYGVETF